MTENRRRFFRIDDTVGLEIYPLDQQTYEQGIRRLRLAPQQVQQNEILSDLDSALRLGLQQLRNTQPEIAALIELLDRKIESISAQIKPPGAKEIALHEVNLSACGIAMRLGEGSYQSDDRLRLILHLFPEQIQIEIYARVIHIQHDATPPPLIAVEFEYMRDNDLDLLIQHIMQRQQLLLRQQLSP
jgi:c-di-GMP-binding flagellar brake protein YcgR